MRSDALTGADTILPGTWAAIEAATIPNATATHVHRIARVSQSSRAEVGRWGDELSPPNAVNGGVDAVKWRG